MHAVRWLWWTIFDRHKAPMVWFVVPTFVLCISVAGLLGAIDGMETGYAIAAILVSAAVLPFGVRRATRRWRALEAEESRRP